MRFRVQLESQGQGGFVATCADFSGCRAEGRTRDEALARIRSAIAFYQEMCPCDVTSEAGLELDVTDAPRS